MTFVRELRGPAGAPTVLLLHGLAASADLNWFQAFEPLAHHFRVIALDHRGHGRGIRSSEHFRLASCADDAVALADHLAVDSFIPVGYSMGGPIASLLARDHPEWVSGVVLAATAMDWSGRRMRTFWRTMAVLRLAMGLAPESFWQRGLRAGGFPDSQITTWTAAELSRGNSVDIAEAGRELGRYNARSWIAGLDAPGAVIVTTEDTAVPPPKQRALAAAMSAPAFEVRGDHSSVITRPDEFNAQLLKALDAARDPRAAATT